MSMRSTTRTPPSQLLPVCVRGSFLLRLIAAWCWSSTSWRAALLLCTTTTTSLTSGVAGYVQGDVIHIEPDVVRPLTPITDNFHYQQIGLCDSELLTAPEKFQLLIGLNVTSQEVCTQRLNGEEVKALELLIDYEYYVRFLANSMNSTRAAQQHVADDEDHKLISRLHMDHFLGVKLEDLSQFKQFMREHNSDDTQDLPNDFRLGLQDPLKPSHWIYTHKAFVFYFDPDSRKVLDAMVEVNDLQLVSVHTHLTFRHSVFWLPRKAEDFHRASIPPSGMEFEFSVHPSFLFLPLLFTFCLFLIINRGLDDVDLFEEQTFGNEFRHLESHPGLLRWLQKQFLAMGTSDPLLEDPVLRAGVSNQSSAPFLQLVLGVSHLAVVLGAEVVTLFVSFVLLEFFLVRGNYYASGSSDNFNSEQNSTSSELISDQSAFVLSILFAGCVSGALFTEAKLATQKLKNKEKRTNDFFVQQPLSAQLPEHQAGVAGVMPFSREISSKNKSTAGEHKKHLPNNRPQELSAFPEINLVEKNSNDNNAAAAAGGTQGSSPHDLPEDHSLILVDFLLFAVGRCVLQLVTFGLFLNTGAWVGLFAASSVGFALGCGARCGFLVGDCGTSSSKVDGVSTSNKTTNGRTSYSFFSLLSQLFVAPDAAGRHLHNYRRMNNTSNSAARLLSTSPHGGVSTFDGTSSTTSSSTNITPLPAKKQILFAAVHAAVLSGYSVALYEAVLKHELFLVLTVPERTLSEILVTVVIWMGMVALWSSFWTLVSGAVFAHPVKSSPILWQLSGAGLAGAVLTGYFWHPSELDTAAHKLEQFCMYFGYFLIFLPSVCFFVSHLGSRFVLNGVVRPLSLKKWK
ncbi:unnamed protein product [Amoebophrya sp. A120]|nr:unnamed protein product [Amoebophrya sp. A120]|eukprot:GSA120T00023587001.1